MVPQVQQAARHRVHQHQAAGAGRLHDLVRYQAPMMGDCIDLGSWGAGAPGSPPTTHCCLLRRRYDEPELLSLIEKRLDQPVERAALAKSSGRLLLPQSMRNVVYVSRGLPHHAFLLRARFNVRAPVRVAGTARPSSGPW